MKKSDLDLLNYLLSENVSDEEKNIVVSKNNKKLIIYAVALSFTVLAATIERITNVTVNISSIPT